MMDPKRPTQDYW